MGKNVEAIDKKVPQAFRLCFYYATAAEAKNAKTEGIQAVESDEKGQFKLKNPVVLKNPVELGWQQFCCPEQGPGDSVFAAKLRTLGVVGDEGPDHLLLLKVPEVLIEKHRQEVSKRTGGTEEDGATFPIPHESLFKGRRRQPRHWSRTHIEKSWNLRGSQKGGKPEPEPEPEPEPGPEGSTKRMTRAELNAKVDVARSLSAEEAAVEEAVPPDKPEP